MNYDTNRTRHETVINIVKPTGFTGGLEFVNLTYTVTKKKKTDDGKWVNQDTDLLNRITGFAPKGCVTAVMGPSGAGKSTFLDGLAGRIASGSLKGKVLLDGAEMSPSLIKRTSAYIMQDDRLFSMLTVYETLMFAADFRLGSIPKAEKRRRVEMLIEQLGLSSARNTYIGDEGTRGVSGGERRRVSIGVDIIHGPSLLFLDEPTSGLDSTSAQSVIEKVHNIAQTGSTVVLTIHQPSSRILLLLDHLIILARGQLMYQGSPKEVASHLGRMGRKVPKGESPIEFLIDVIQRYDQSEYGVDALAEFVVTGKKPPELSDDDEMSVLTPTPQTPRRSSGKKSRFQVDGYHEQEKGFDHSVRSPWNNSNTWSQSGIMQTIKTTPSRFRSDKKQSQARGFYPNSGDTLSSTTTPQSSSYTLNEDDYRTPPTAAHAGNHHHQLTSKFPNSFFPETWILIRRNFINIRRTPELFLSRLMVLTIMGFMMATMFKNPGKTMQGITNRLSFFIFTVCLFFFSSNDAVPAFIQERFIFVRETSHNAYRASSYTIAGLITYLPFLLLQAAVYAGLTWFALKLEGPFVYFLVVLYVSLLSTNSFVVFVSSVVPNFILGYAAVIAFTALFFLFCGYFLNSHDIPKPWRWMNVISTMTYPYEGLLINEFQRDEVFGVNLGGGNVTGVDILQSLHIYHVKDPKWFKDSNPLDRRHMKLYQQVWTYHFRIVNFYALNVNNVKRSSIFLVSAPLRKGLFKLQFHMISELEAMVICENSMATGERDRPEEVTETATADHNDGWQQVRNKKTRRKDHILMAKAATSFFFQNFPEGTSERALRQLFQPYGTVVDVSVPHKRDKANRQFGFVRFLKVSNPADFVQRLHQIWIGSYKVRVYIAKYQRAPKPQYMHTSIPARTQTHKTHPFHQHTNQRNPPPPPQKKTKTKLPKGHLPSQQQKLRGDCWWSGKPQHNQKK
ncbi:hypothetical protein LXL04_006952 [Taraxacum kok-saghyz]